MAKTPLEIFDEFVESMLSGTDAWMRLVAEDVHFCGPIAEFEGKAMFIELNVPYFASIRKHEIIQVIVSGEYVATQITVDVDMPSGNVITLEVAEWYEIRDGLIQALRTYFDPSEYLKEMEG